MLEQQQHNYHSNCDWSTSGDYNATAAAARAHAFRTHVYIGIYRALCVVDGVLGLLLLLYAVALFVNETTMWSSRPESFEAKRIANRVAYMTFCWGLLLWLRVLLVLWVLSRSTRPSIPWYCFGTWRLATVWTSAVLALCYGTATVWLLWDCVTCRDSDNDPTNTTLYSFENDSWPESVLVAHRQHCTTTATCQGGMWTAWLSTHSHELLLPHSWVQSWLEESLFWSMLGLTALEGTRAVYAQCTLSFHFPPNDHHNESSDTLADPLLATTRPSSWSWHEEAVPKSGQRQWWRRKTRRRRDHHPEEEEEDEDAHLFAAISEDWADRARDDPLWWSRE
jgi:hypothetical protein